MSTSSNSNSINSGGRLRRSARATAPTTKTMAEPNSDSYSEGDLVKVQQGEGGTTVHVRLVKLLVEGDAIDNSKWLVRLIDEGDTSDEVPKNKEMYERDFVGKVTPPSGSVDSEKDHPRHNIAYAEEKAGAADYNGEVEPAQDDLPSDTPGPTGRASSDSSVNTGTNRTGSKLSSRESRSRRRQAMIDVTGGAQESEGIGAATTASSTDNGTGLPRKRKLTGAAKVSVQNKKREGSATSGSANNQTSNNTNAKRAGSAGGTVNNGSNKNKNANEECVKIKLLTGTLYLYRGRNRRAEFIRRV